MIFSDYHTHTKFSDGRNSMSEMCREAVTLGMREIAFTEHAEWRRGRNGYSADVENYFHVLERNRVFFEPMNLRVMSGVELGNPHEHASLAQQLLDEAEFEVVIGSLHWLYGGSVHRVNCFFGRHPLTVYTDYFDETAVMLRDFDMHILAHSDRIFWQGAQLGLLPAVADIENSVRRMLEVLIRKDVAFEVNLRLLGSRQHWHEQLTAILRWYSEMGGDKVVVNSDAHHTSHLTLNRELAADLIADAGCVGANVEGSLERYKRDPDL